MFGSTELARPREASLYELRCLIPRKFPGRCALARTNLLCARPLGALTGLERDLLAFVELIETRAFHSRHVEEQVLATARVDESKTLVGKTLNCTFSHNRFF